MSEKAPEIENYLNYADERRVTISVLEVFGGVEEPHEVYHASVPGDTPLGRDGITKCFLEHLYGKDGYAIDQRLSIYECGASGMLQDISVEVIGGVATPFVLYALHGLRTWIASSQHAQEPRSVEDCLRSLTDLIQCRYRSSGQVQLKSHEATTDSVSAVFRDEPGTTYSCSIERLTGISTIKTRRKTPSKPRRTKRMQATARMASVESATLPARRSGIGSCHKGGGAGRVKTAANGQ